MELAEIFKILWARKLVTLAILTLAVAAAVGAKLATRSAPKGAATVQIFVDSPNSALANLVQNTTPLTARATVFAQVMASQAVLEDIGKAASIPVSQISAEGPYSGSGQKLDVVTPSEARGNQLLAQGAKYRLTFVAQENQPLITTSVQAPTAAAAAQLASGVYPGVVAYISGLQKTMNTPSTQRVTIRQLGPPQSGTVSSGAGATVAVAAALGVLLLGGLILVGVEGARRRTLAPEPQELEREPQERSLTHDFDAAVISAGFDGVAAAGARTRGGLREVAERRAAARAAQYDPERLSAVPLGRRD
ncbi:MAG TPA: Wzz/FepE/Etk N-terminal domain-containing protein [Solirubrobacteraceae bacterium]|nr:Wzz/FepE/Etk N-terminal domain-containing protein [Solirubrobacteraceae bacterium]